jgi:hypothetical protein
LRSDLRKLSFTAPSGPGNGLMLATQLTDELEISHPP